MSVVKTITLIALGQLLANDIRATTSGTTNRASAAKAKTKGFFSELGTGEFDREAMEKLGPPHLPRTT